MILGFLFWLSASIGFQDYTEIINGEDFIHKPLFAELEVHAESEYIDLYAVQNMECYSNPVTFYPSPMQMESIVGISLGTPHISINAEHGKYYPIVQEYYHLTDIKQGGYTKIWLELSSKKR